MRLFAYRAAAFGAGFLGILLLCSAHYAILSRRDNLNVQLHLYSRAQPEVLVLGDSHPAMDLDMRLLGPRYFSLAYPQENWREILLKARFALDAKPGIRVIVIPVDLHMFADYRNQDEDLTHSMHFNRSYRDLAALYGGQMFPIHYARSLETFYLPLTAGPNWSNYRVLVLDDCLHLLGRPSQRKHIEIDRFGSISYSDSRTFDSLPMSSRLEVARARAIEQLHDPIVCAPLVRAFDEFLDLCAGRGIRVVGVRFPLTPEFRRAAMAYDVARVERVYRDRVGRLATILDYADSLDLAPASFRDEDHLTPRGSWVFTSRLSRDLERILSQTAPPRMVSRSDGPDSIKVRRAQPISNMMPDRCST